tara:strand:+ start:35 stop:520 length:486 start_codon:yes stop_codon:yes gene_type:complete
MSKLFLGQQWRSKTLAFGATKTDNILFSLERIMAKPERRCFKKVKGQDWKVGKMCNPLGSATKYATGGAGKKPKVKKVLKIVKDAPKKRKPRVKAALNIVKDAPKKRKKPRVKAALNIVKDAPKKRKQRRMTPAEMRRRELEQQREANERYGDSFSIQPYL